VKQDFSGVTDRNAQWLRLFWNHLVDQGTCPYVPPYTFSTILWTGQ